MTFPPSSLVGLISENSYFSFFKGLGFDRERENLAGVELGTRKRKIFLMRKRICRGKEKCKLLF